MRLCFLLFIALLASSSASASEPVWHEFDFAVSDAFGFGKERVALLLHAKVNQKDCRVQLDTGANMDVLWHSKPNPGVAAQLVPVTLQIGDVKREVLANAANLAPLDRDECDGVVATVGNAFFDHGTLTLDLGRDRFAFTKGPTLSGHPAAQPMLYLRAGSDGGHPLVDIALDNGRRGQVLLDTGAARFGLAATDATEWAELSGGMPLKASAAVRTFSVSNAKDAEASACYDTLVAGHMMVGGQRLPQTMVSYCRGKEFHLPRPLVAVLGLLPLGKRRLVIDYVGQRWLLGD